MRRKVSISSLFLAWLCANGALLDAVQVLAWGNMFATYAKTMSVTAALDATFDPARACELCIGVAQARDTTENQAPAPTGNEAVKLVLVCEKSPARFVFSAPPIEWPAALASAGPTWLDSVPLPPPRA